METLGISFIDYGDVRGSFAYSLADSLVHLRDHIEVTHIFRWSSSNIPMNRHTSLVDFAENSDADWLLCIDSDISFSAENIKRLWEIKSDEIQVLSGVYFLPRPGAPTHGHIYPALFSKIHGDLEVGEAEYFHPLPFNSVVKIVRAGFGFLLLSRKVVQKVLDSFEGNIFAERFIGEEPVGEDFIFFEKLEKLGIQAYADTGNIVGHEKQIMINLDFYQAYWNLIYPSVLGLNRDES